MHCLSCHLLTAQSPLLACILQFPIARGVDLGVPLGEHVLRRDVADGAVQANVVKCSTYPSTRRRASSRDSGVPGRTYSPLSDLCQRSIFPFD